MLSVPAIEKISNPKAFTQITNNASAKESVSYRHLHATAICDYLKRPYRGKANDYYQSTAALLELPENTRLALYLPLEELQDAPDYFRASYMAAWRKCLRFEDVRENFNLGDSLEISARDENFPYVVKAAHFIPWLLRYGYLGEAYVLELLEQGSDCLIRSICDCEKIFYHIYFQTSPEFQLRISKCARSLPEKKSKPLFNSPERQKWLDEYTEEAWDKLIPHNITGPFSKNFHIWDIMQLTGDEIVLVGGSYIKGYGLTTSDIDTYSYDPDKMRVGNYCKELDAYLDVPNQNIAHICLDTVWISNRRNLEYIQEECIRRYLRLAPDSLERKQSLERLEQDLLQYRLMHKGIRRIYSNVSERTHCFPGIDGASAFYDRRYRRIASQLFVKYVFLPCI